MAEFKQLEVIVNELTKSANPSEEGFKTLIDSVNSDDVEIKKYLAQNLSHFIEKIPSLAKEALEAQIKLSEDEDISIKSFGIRNLFEFASVEPSKIVLLLCKLFKESSGQISTVVKSNFKQNLTKADQKFLDAFISVMKDSSRTTDEKNDMVKILSDYYEFSAQTKEQLISTIDVSLTADTVYAIHLIRKYSEFLSPKERDDRVNSFMNDMYMKLSKDDESYINAIVHVFNPSVSCIPFKEGTAGQRLFSIVAEQVFPKLYLLEESTQAIALRLVADSARFANENGVNELIPSLYENIFMKVGVYFKNMFVIEPMFFLMNTLVKANPYKMSDEFGVIFVTDGTGKKPNDAKKAQISIVTSLVQEEVNKQIDSARNEANNAPEEEKRKLTRHADAVEKAANNCFEFTTWLTSKTPMTERKPKNPSWAKIKDKKAAKQNSQPKRKANFRNGRDTGYGRNRNGFGRGRGGYNRGGNERNDGEQENQGDYNEEE